MTFPEILEHYGVSYLREGNHHCRPGWVQISCPFCERGMDGFHMGYNLSKGYLNCYKCCGHSVLSTLEELTNEPRHALRAMLAGLDSTLEPEQVSKRGKLTLPKPLGDITGAFRDYLVGRGYKVEDLIRDWKIRSLGQIGHVTTPEGRSIALPWRIFIPFEHNGEVVSWNTRAINPEVDRRYITAPEECEALDAKELLYGEEHCLHAVCAVEGAFDVWAGGFGFVSTGGTSFKRAQVLRLARYNVRGVCFDAEPGAQRQARELCDMLSAFPGKTFNFVLDSKDASEDMESNRGREVAQIRRTLGI